MNLPVSVYTTRVRRGLVSRIARIPVSSHGHGPGKGVTQSGCGPLSSIAAGNPYDLAGLGDLFELKVRFHRSVLPTHRSHTCSGRGVFVSFPYVKLG